MTNAQGAAAEPTHASAVETLENRISKTPGVCGGDACIRGTRIPIWLLVEQQRHGESDAGILESHPTLSSADLEATRDDYASHRADPYPWRRLLKYPAVSTNPSRW